MKYIFVVRGCYLLNRKSSIKTEIKCTNDERLRQFDLLLFERPLNSIQLWLGADRTKC